MNRRERISKFLTTPDSKPSHRVLDPDGDHPHHHLDDTALVGFLRGGGFWGAGTGGGLCLWGFLIAKWIDSGGRATL